MGASQVMERRPLREITGGRGGVPLYEEDIDRFLNVLRERRRSEGTIAVYREYLRALSAYLDGDPLQRDTLLQWREEQLREGYMAQTVNTRISAANSYLEYIGRRDLQLENLPQEQRLMPELTRQEYLRLLQAARARGAIRAYLYIKVFAVVGLTVKELPCVTVEAVRAGQVLLPHGPVRIPDVLQRELLRYGEKNGIGCGPLFVTQSGKPVYRTNVSNEIRALSRAAQVPGEKCNPRCLRKLYLTTRGQIQQTVSRLMEQTYDQLLEAEQMVIGWKDGTGGEGP